MDEYDITVEFRLHAHWLHPAKNTEEAVIRGAMQAELNNLSFRCEQILEEIISIRRKK